LLKQKIIKETIKIADYNVSVNKLQLEAVSMKDYYYKQQQEIVKWCDLNNSKSLESEQALIKILTKCDPTYSAIYSMLPKLKMKTISREKNRTIQNCIKNTTKIKNNKHPE